jgi:hypothetical protein
LLWILSTNPDILNNIFKYNLSWLLNFFDVPLDFFLPLKENASFISSLLTVLGLYTKFSVS